MQRQREKRIRVFLCALVCAYTYVCVVCVCGNMCVHQYDSFRAAVLGRLIFSHLRSWVRIIKPISRRWLLRPVCDWITTQPLPSAQQRERMREVENETQGKKEIRKEINKKKAVRGKLVVGGRETEKRQRPKDQDLQYVLSAHQIYSKCFWCRLPIKCTTFNLLTFQLKNDLSYTNSPLLVLLYILYPWCRVSEAYVLVTY